MYKHLCQVQEYGQPEYAMVGYILNNTLTDHGYVTRGVCQVKEGYLTEIIERKQIERQAGVVKYLENQKWQEVAADSLVSMNMWALTPDIFTQLEEGFVDFLEHEVPLDVEKSECLIPITIGKLIQANEAQVKVYASHDTWQGVTYKEDKAGVKAALAQLKEKGLYPKKLWGELDR